MGAALSRRVVLRTADAGDAVMAGVPSRAVPSTWPAGRALLVDDDAVLSAQVALLADDASGSAQAAALAALGVDPISSGSTGSSGEDATGSTGSTAGGPPAVPAMPGEVGLDDVRLQIPAGRSAPTWLPLGVGGPQVTPQGWEPARQGPVLLVGGHPGSGRSTALLVLAHGARASGRPVVVVAGRRSPLEEVAGTVAVHPDDAAGLDHALAAARAAGTPALVLLDDVETLDGTAVEPVLAALLGHLDAGDGHGEAVAAAGSTPELLTRFAGLAVRLRRPGVGLVLGPAAPTDGDLLGVRLGRASQRRPGRGALVQRGAWIPLQVALP